MQPNILRAHALSGNPNIIITDYCTIITIIFPWQAVAFHLEANLLQWSEYENEADSGYQK